MGTLYVTQEDCFIGKTDERLQVTAQSKQPVGSGFSTKREILIDVPMIKVEGVVAVGRATVSPAAIAELLDRNIPLSFLTTTGRYLGRLEPEVTKNIFVRRAQWAAAGRVDETTIAASHVVQGFIRGKLKNCRNGLLRSRREGNSTELDGAIQKLEQAIEPINRTQAIDSLRGLEGAGSAAYFSSFGSLLLNSDFTFKTRNRRPPVDPVNALLSLGYALLRHDVQSALNIVGFDPYLGYLHTVRYGRPSLALDLMEEFRPVVVDAVVLTAINRGYVTLESFETEPVSGAVSLTRDGLKAFLRLYEQKKQSKFKHPVMRRQCTYQEAFELQARLLSKYLLGQTELYPPLVLK
jgi:CRISP-associated protein Cas1